MTSATFPSPAHDHGHCIRQALDAAEDRCKSNGARLTELRRRVLELVWQSHAPVGAYALLDILKAEGQNAAPPTVYRALDFLLEQGLVHRVASLNAYMGCSHPGQPHAAKLLICRKCGRAAELDDPTLDEAVRASAERLGFSLTSQSIEAEGLCADCRD